MKRWTILASGILLTPEAATAAAFDANQIVYVIQRQFVSDADYYTVLRLSNDSGVTLTGARVTCDFYDGNEIAVGGAEADANEVQAGRRAILTLKIRLPPNVNSDAIRTTCNVSYSTE